MQINENKKSLRTAALILLIFNIYQLIAIYFYWLFLVLLIIDFDWMLLSGSTMYKHLLLQSSPCVSCHDWLFLEISNDEIIFAIPLFI